MEKYGRDFEEDADVVDLQSGKLIIDNGFMRGMEMLEFGDAFQSHEEEGDGNSAVSSQLMCATAETGGDRVLVIGSDDIRSGGEEDAQNNTAISNVDFYNDDQFGLFSAGSVHSSDPGYEVVKRRYSSDSELLSGGDHVGDDALDRYDRRHRTNSDPDQWIIGSTAASYGDIESCDDELLVDDFFGPPRLRVSLLKTVGTSDVSEILSSDDEIDDDECSEEEQDDEDTTASEVSAGSDEECNSEQEHQSSSQYATYEDDEENAFFIRNLFETPKTDDLLCRKRALADLTNDQSPSLRIFGAGIFFSQQRSKRQRSSNSEGPLVFKPSAVIEIADSAETQSDKENDDDDTPLKKWRCENKSSLPGPLVFSAPTLSERL